jgi:hypothetical protein
VGVRCRLSHTTAPGGDRLEHPPQLLFTQHTAIPDGQGGFCEEWCQRGPDPAAPCPSRNRITTRYNEMQSFQRPFMTWRTQGGCPGGGSAAVSGMGPLWKPVWVMMGMPPIFTGALMFITAPDGYLFCWFCFFPHGIWSFTPIPPWSVGRFMKILVWSCGATNTAGFGEHTQDKMKRSIPDHVPCQWFCAASC